MTLSHLPRAVRRKAVWGPKRIVAASALVLLALSTSVAAAAPDKSQKPKHSRQAPKAKAGLPNSFVKDYKLDGQLTERNEHNQKTHDARETVDSLIVTLTGSGGQLGAFKKYVCAGTSRLDIINGYELCNVPVNKLSELSKLTDVHRAHYNRRAHQTDLLSSAAVQADILTQQYGYSGAGITVAVIDSGLTNEQHPDLKDSRVLKFVDFVNPSNFQRSDEHGHGTHVTGIIAGTGKSDSRFQGIAPGTKVVSLKVLDQNGTGSIGQIIAALNWVNDHAEEYNIRIVSMSVGAGVYESYWTDPLTLAAKALVDRGITVVAAAGNRGKNAAGQLQWGGITSPGVAPWVLTVCAFSTMGTLDTGDDVMGSFSSSGPTAVDFGAKPDVCAPGVGIVSMASPGSTLYERGLLATPSFLLGSDPSFGFTPYLSLTGTSQATPFVAGTVAMMLQANPNLTPNLVKAILQYTANFKPDLSALRQGAGFMNSLGAVTLASFYAHATPGMTLPIDPSWSTHIIWGNHMLGSGVLDPSANAWDLGVEWGWAKTDGDDGDNIVWGTSDDDDNIVWGTSDDDDNIVWGTSDDDDNIVWGTDCGGDDCDNIVWGSSDDDDNIVWGTSDDDDNIVWGTSDDDDNIVWGTSDDDDNIVWGTAAEPTSVWPIYKPAASRAAVSKKGGK